MNFTKNNTYNDSQINDMIDRINKENGYKPPVWGGPTDLQIAQAKLMLMEEGVAPESEQNEFQNQSTLQVFDTEDSPDFEGLYRPEKTLQDQIDDGIKSISENNFSTRGKQATVDQTSPYNNPDRYNPISENDVLLTGGTDLDEIETMTDLAMITSTPRGLEMLEQ